MMRNLVLLGTIGTCIWATSLGQILRQLDSTGTDEPLVITMAVPHLEVEPAYLALEGRNLGSNPEVFLGSVAGSMEPLAIIASSESFIEVALPETLPGTYLLVVSSGELEKEQMFALYVSLNPSSHSVLSEEVIEKMREPSRRTSTGSRFLGFKPATDSSRLDSPASPALSADAAGTKSLITSLDPPRPIPFALVPKWEENGTDIYYSTGYVGIGVSTPLAPLHIYSSDSIQKIIHAESNGPEAVRNLMVLENNGMAQFRLVDSSPNGDSWQFSNTDSGFNISLQGSGVQEFLIEDNGDVSLSGTLNVNTIRVKGAITSDGEICIGSGC